MDPKLESHIDEIFRDVPKTDKLVSMINSIKSKANTKYLDTIEQGYSRNIALNQVDDWLMKAKVIVNEEVGKLTPADISDLPTATRGAPGTVVSSAAIEGQDGPAMVLERADSYDGGADADAYSEMYYSDDSDEQGTPEEESAKGKKGKKKKARGRREKEVEEVEVEIPHTGLIGKLIGSILVIAGIALIAVAILIVAGLIKIP